MIRQERPDAVGKATERNRDANASAPAMAEQVTVALGEIAGDVREGLLALAVGAGLQVMTAMMAADVTALS